MLATLDWIIIVLFIVLIVAIGLSYTKKAGKNLESFFLGSRNLPWYIAGISMVATTFAADTPLAVTELVGQSGISGNWLWWNFLAGGMLTTFFFANLWRRAEVLTEVELIEMRYHGKPAAFLRGFKSVYLGVFMNVMIIGWVNLALATLLEVFFNIPSATALKFTGLAMLLVAVYSSMSGLLGVVFTDVIQFVVAMTGCIILAILVLQAPEVGGISGLKEQLPEGTLSFFPTVGESSGSNTLAIGFGAFFAYIGIQWWASWYPGAEPGGGGYVAQRMMSAKNEKHAIYATLFFQIAHYCLRPWPWIIVALAAIVLYNFDAELIAPEQAEMRSSVKAIQQHTNLPDNIFTKSAEELKKMAETDAEVADNLQELVLLNPQLKEYTKVSPEFAKAYEYTANTRKGYVYAMMDYLPVGLKGLLLVAFFAAYMSTISTQLNWGASYVVNDLYYRFIKPDSTNEHLVTIARLTTLLLLIIGLGVTMVITSISGVWAFIIECGAGLGLVLILRWYWWRINAWSEIVATIAPFLAYAACRWVFNIQFPQSFFITVGFTTLAWLAATFLTKPTNMEHLKGFYNKVRPDGNWGPVKALTNHAGKQSRLGGLVLCWLSAVAMTYAILFASGKLLFMEWTAAIIWIGVGIVSFILLKSGLAKTRILED